MASRASPDRFRAAVKRYFKDEPDKVRLVRITDDEPEECDVGDIDKRPGKFEIRRAGSSGEILIWTDSADEAHESGTVIDKARARDLERAGLSWGVNLSMSQQDNERLYKRVEKLEEQLEKERDENKRLTEKLAEQIAAGGIESEALQCAMQIAERLLDRKFVDELHRRLNNCRGLLTKAEADRVNQIINSPEFRRMEDGSTHEPPRLDA